MPLRCSAARWRCGQPHHTSTIRTTARSRLVVRADVKDNGTGRNGTVTLRATSPAVRAVSPSTASEKGGTSFLQSLSGTFTRNGSAAPASGEKTIFVAGATGRLGARVVRELLAAGFKVRAGARDVEAAQKAVDVAEAYGLLSARQLQQLEIVEVDITQPDTLRQAIGNASKVVCAVGAPESDALNVAAPKQIDGDGTIALINAASAAGVQQFVLVTSLGTEKVGWPASILNLFWGVLLWKRQAEQALQASGMAYTIVRPGGMERPTDTYKRSHSLVLSTKNTQFGGQVSRLQVAELVASMMVTPELAANKVVEVTAEAGAPQLTFQELLASVPSERSQEEQVRLREASLEVMDEIEEAEQKLAQAKEAVAAAEARTKELNARLQEAKAQEAEVRAKFGPVMKDGATADKALEGARAAAKQASLRESAAKAVLEAARKAGAQGQLLDKKQIAAVAEQVMNPPKAAPPAPTAAAKAASPAPAATKPLFGFFGDAKSSAPASGEEQEEAEAPVPRLTSPPPRSASPPAFSLGRLFGSQEPEQQLAEQETAKAAAPAPAPISAPAPAPAKPAKAAPSPPAAAAPPPPAPTAEQAKAVPKQAKAAAKVEQPAPAPAEGKEAQEEQAGPPGGFLAKLFGWGQAVDANPEAPPALEQAAAAAKPVVAAAAQAVKEAPKAAVAAAAQAASPKAAAAAATAPSAPTIKPVTSSPEPAEPPELVEQRALSALAQERQAKADAVAKARASVEAEELKALKATNVALAKLTAPSRTDQVSVPKPKSVEPASEPKPAVPVPAKPAAPVAAKPAAPVAAKPVAPVASKPAAPIAPVKDDAEARKKEAQQWIAAWKAKKAAPVTKAAPSKKSGDYDAEAAAAAQKEAKAWIDAWKAKRSKA